MSAFFFYLGEQVPIAKEENKKLSHKEATAEVSARWNELGDDDKGPYNKMHDEAKARYFLCV